MCLIKDVRLNNKESTITAKDWKTYIYIYVCVCVCFFEITGNSEIVFHFLDKFISLIQPRQMEFK